MSGVIRRVLGLGGVALLALLLAAAAGAAPPEGPRLAFLSLTRDKAGTVRLQTVDSAGGARTVLFGGTLGGKKLSPNPLLGLSWSPDGSRLAFVGGTGKSRQEEIYVVGADGSGLRAVAGTKEGSHPVFSPDGHTIAFSRSRLRLHIDKRHLGKVRTYSSETTWIGDVEGGAPRRLTPWRNGLSNTPASFSLDGSVLALTKEDSNLDGPRTVLMHLDGSGSSVLSYLAREPAISPDGSRVAYVSYVDGDTVKAEENHVVAVPELYVMNTDGTGVRRLTHSPKLIESAPQWDPSGQRIVYEQSSAGTGFLPELESLFPFGNKAMEINADGSCRQKLFSFPKVAVYGATWQPGPGREAGPISC
jgi:Tol biopolymer transport system component